jgi:L-asparaginase
MAEAPIQVLTTGGTIDKVYFDKKSTFEVGDPQIGEVLARARVTFEYTVRTLFKKDSLDLTDEDRQVVRQAIASDTVHRRFVVTHGIDTMVETAKALAGLEDKVIVLTGSAEPARFQESSAIFNIGCAVVAVQALPPGVYITMNGRIFDPERVRKNRELNRFEEV